MSTASSKRRLSFLCITLLAALGVVAITGCAASPNSPVEQSADKEPATSDGTGEGSAVPALSQAPVSDEDVQKVGVGELTFEIPVADEYEESPIGDVLSYFWTLDDGRIVQGLWYQTDTTRDEALKWSPTIMNQAQFAEGDSGDVNGIEYVSCSFHQSVDGQPETAKQAQFFYDGHKYKMSVYIKDDSVSTVDFESIIKSVSLNK